MNENIVNFMNFIDFDRDKKVENKMGNPGGGNYTPFVTRDQTLNLALCLS